MIMYVETVSRFIAGSIYIMIYSMSACKGLDRATVDSVGVGNDTGSDLADFSVPAFLLIRSEPCENGAWSLETDDG